MIGFEIESFIVGWERGFFLVHGKNYANLFLWETVLETARELAALQQTIPYSGWCQFNCLRNLRERAALLAHGKDA
jgi:hypothetical protein